MEQPISDIKFGLMTAKRGMGRAVEIGKLVQTLKQRFLLGARIYGG